MLRSSRTPSPAVDRGCVARREMVPGLRGPAAEHVELGVGLALRAGVDLFVQGAARLLLGNAAWPLACHVAVAVVHVSR
ncbi:hypothetical protein GCM10009837_69350 [Streptomyces durmitorensis]